MGCPIRKSTDQSLFAAPHGLSQRITSFIACACQGIHQMPLYHLIIPIANVHLFGFVHADPQCGDRLHSARIAKQSDGRSAYAGHIRRRGLFERFGRLPRGVHFAKERGVHGMSSHSTTRRLPCRSSTANMGDVQSLPCPAAVLYANPFWRKDWRKTSFLRRSPMPRGQAWQSKQGSPFLKLCRRILANAPSKLLG